MTRLLYWIGRKSVSQEIWNLFHQIGIKQISSDQADKDTTIVLYPRPEAIFTDTINALDHITDACQLAVKGFRACAEWRIEKLPFDALRELVENGHTTYKHELIDAPDPISDPIISILTKELLRMQPSLDKAYCYLEENSIRFGSEPDLDCALRLMENSKIETILARWDSDYHDNSCSLRKQLAIALGHLRDSDDLCAKLDSIVLGSLASQIPGDLHAKTLLNKYRQNHYKLLTLMSVLLSDREHAALVKTFAGFNEQVKF